VQIFRGFWLVRWFKEQFGHPEQALASDLGVATESLFDELIAQVPAGCEGLVLQPYWSPGVRHPGPEARGAIIGFSDVHTRAHLYRAILEGLAHALRDGMAQIERRGGITVRELRVAGGGAQSDAAMQLTADLFNLPAERAHTHETSGLGAAMATAVGLGLHRDFAGAVAAMSHRGRRFDPDSARAATYQRLHRDVYQRMYRQLAPLYRRLARIGR
jgi:sugar (pentulose or hexulose) kinase